MDNNEKIQLDDITFDDVIAGDGVATEEIAPVQKDEVSITETPDNDPVEDDLLEEEEIEEEEEEEEDDSDEEYENEYEEDGDRDEDENEEYDEELDDTVVSSILDNLGYEVDQDYEDTAEGLTALTKDMADRIANDKMDDVLKQFPLVKNHLQYVLNGGQSQDFMQAYDPNMDYNTLAISEGDISSQKAILADYLAIKGHDGDFINEMVEDYEDTGKLFNKSEAARKALGKYQSQQREQLMEQQVEKQKEEKQQLQQFWGGVADTIQQSREFAGLTVPEREKNKFFDYLSRPIDEEGRTQRDVDHLEAEMETKLAIDYLMYKGFDLETIINTKARTKSTRSLKDRIVKNESRAKSARKASRRNKNFDVDDLDLTI
tara:strand:+ start:2930 stop:4054 length:1125 start_codon:yes stop_codon:yes gene_type:complete